MQVLHKPIHAVHLDNLARYVQRGKVESLQIAKCLIPDLSFMSEQTAAVLSEDAGSQSHNEESHLMRWLSKSIDGPELQTNSLSSNQTGPSNLTNPRIRALASN